MTAQTSLFTGPLLVAAARDAFAKLNPRTLIRNPVMFVTAIVAALSTVLLIKGIATGGSGIAFQAQLVFWLWLTLLFGNFAEAMAEGRGKAQAASLRATKAELKAKLLLGTGDLYETVGASQLEVGEIVLVETGDLIPADGEVVEGWRASMRLRLPGKAHPLFAKPAATAPL